jgi:hypothetical protein
MQRSSLIYLGRRGLGQRSPLLVLGLHSWSHLSRGGWVECTRGWDHFIESLRQYVEVGRGMPRGSDADKARRV